MQVLRTPIHFCVQAAASEEVGLLQCGCYCTAVLFCGRSGGSDVVLQRIMRRVVCHGKVYAHGVLRGQCGHRCWQCAEQLYLQMDERRRTRQRMLPMRRTCALAASKAATKPCIHTYPIFKHHSVASATKCPKVPCCNAVVRYKDTPHFNIHLHVR